MTQSGNKNQLSLSIDDEESLFHSLQTVAIVGLSDKPDRPSYKVAQYLIEHGFIVVPVNPDVEKVLGNKSYPSLLDIPFEVDIVDIFRRTEYVKPIVDEAIKIQAKVIWMQEGIVDIQAARKAEKAGLLVQMDKCLKKEHLKFKNHS